MKFRFRMLIIRSITVAVVCEYIWNGTARRNGSIAVLLAAAPLYNRIPYRNLNFDTEKFKIQIFLKLSRETVYREYTRAEYTEESSSSQQNGKWCRIDFRFSCHGLNFFCRGTGVSRSYLKCSESKEVRSFHSTLTGSSLLYHILAC